MRGFWAALLLLTTSGCLPNSAEAYLPESPEEQPPASEAAPVSQGIASEPQEIQGLSVARDRTPLRYDGELTQGGWIRGTLPSATAWARLGEADLEVRDDLRFFAGLDRDAPREVVLTGQLESGFEFSHVIPVAPREWQIERVNVAKGTGGGGEAWWAKREPEWLAIRDARAMETGSEGWKQEFIWPVTGRISGRFGRQRIYRGEPGSYHSGIDIAPGNGVPFVAPADGVVVLARTGFSLEGGIVIVDHGAGLNSAFIHLSRLAVAEGDTVAQGEVLGNVGATGRASGPHLHWSLTWRGARLDPLLFLPPMP